MKGAPLCLCALLAATLFSLPSKSDETRQVKQKSPYAEWSVGIGIGFGFYFLGLTHITIFDTTPAGRIMVERRMGDKFAILFMGSAWYSEDETSDSSRDRKDIGNSKGFGASIGFRRIINPGGVVEVSFLLQAGGERNESDSTGERERWETSTRHKVLSYAFGACLGLVLERKFTDWLALRFESILVRTSYTVSEVDQRHSDGDTYKPRSESFQVGLAFTPSIQLRMSF